MRARQVIAAFFVVAGAILFAASSAESQEKTRACLWKCEDLPLTKRQADCCTARCFCEYAPDYMTPEEKSKACQAMDVLCR